MQRQWADIVSWIWFLSIVEKNKNTSIFEHYFEKTTELFGMNHVTIEAEEIFRNDTNKQRQKTKHGKTKTLL